MTEKTMTLDVPIQRGDQTITRVQVRKPNAGALRGLSLVEVLQMNVTALQTLLPRVTEPFYMVDKSRARRQGGSGLGLALCQRIAAAHGSALRIESEPGRGTRVSVTLPVWKEDAP